MTRSTGAYGAISLARSLREANEPYVERSLQAYDVSMLAGPFPLELSKLTGKHLVDIACKSDGRASQIYTTSVAKSIALP